MTANQTHPDDDSNLTNDSVSIDNIDQPFEEVFRDEHLKILRLATLLLGSQSLAEEAVQDVFAKLLDRFDSVRNPGGFLRTATINRCRDIKRKSSRERRLLRPVKVETHTETPLDDVLAGISQQRRGILDLRHYVGHTTPEITEILGMPKRTVRSATHRAVAELREVPKRHSKTTTSRKTTKNNNFKTGWAQKLPQSRHLQTFAARYLNEPTKTGASVDVTDSEPAWSQRLP